MNHETYKALERAFKSGRFPTPKAFQAATDIATRRERTERYIEREARRYLRGPVTAWTHYMARAIRGSIDTSKVLDSVEREGSR